MAMDEKQLRDELIKAFRLEQVPEDKRDELLDKLIEALLKRIFLDTMDKIGDAGVAEYEKLLEAESKPEELEAFFEKKIPGYDVFVRDIAREFKEEMTKDL